MRFHEKSPSVRQTPTCPSTVPDELANAASIPPSALNAIMGKLGLAHEANEPEANETDLARALTDPAWAVRVEAIQKLGKIGKQAPLELLLIGLRDTQSNVRVAAARALSRNPRPAALSSLVAAIVDEVWMVRVEIALALGHLAECAPLEPLLLASKDANPMVRAAAIKALGEFSPDEALPPLTQALQDEDWSVREAAALALGQTARRDAIPPLLETRLDSDTSVRAAVEMALQSLDPAAANPPPPSDSFTQWLERTDYSNHQGTPTDTRAGSSEVTRSIVTLPEQKTSLRSLQTSMFQHRKKPLLPELSQHRKKSLPPDLPQKQPRKRKDMVGGVLAAALIICLFSPLFLMTIRPNVSYVGQSNTPTFTTYRRHNSSVSLAVWSPDNRLIASADVKGTVLIWQASTGDTFLRYPHGGEVLALSWISSTMVQVAYVEAQKALEVYTLNIEGSPRYKLLFESTNLPGVPQTAAWSPDGSLLAFDIGNGDIQIWDPTSHILATTIHNPAAQYTQLDWSPDGTQLATISVQSRLQVWNAITGINTANLAASQQVSIATWITYNRSKAPYMLFLDKNNDTSNGSISKWVPSKGPGAYSLLIQQQSYNREDSKNLVAEALTVSPDNSQIDLATSDGIVQILDSTTMNLVYLYTGHEAQVNDVEWSPDGHYIATASADTTVQIWQEPGQ